MVHLRIKNYFAEAQIFNRRVYFAMFMVLVLLGLLIGRLYYLQVMQRQLYTTLSIQNQMSLIPIDPNRGLIYDRNGVLLASNVPVYSLDVVPDRAKDFKNSLEEVKKIIDISPEDLRQYQKGLRQKRSFEGVTLKLNLTEDEVARFYLDQYRFPGFGITARMMRYYPQGDAMVSVLGYVGRINEQEAAQVDSANYAATNYIGKLGIEKFYENELHGTVGYQQVETDANGRVVRILKYIPPISGKSIYLSIDSKLQKAAEEALGDEQGAVVAIDPKNGQVLAFVSNPRYDPNMFVKGVSVADYKALQQDPARPLYNRALRGLYPSGSTIKPFLAIEGLDSGVIDTKFKIRDNGYFYLPGVNRPWKDWNWEHGGHGIVDVHKAIVQSCDTFFNTLAYKMGITRLNDIVYRFGLGHPTGLDVKEELGGVVPSPAWKRAALGQGWYGGDTINAGTGQGYTLVTPLQMAFLSSVMANRGIRHQPRFLMKWQNPDGSMEAVAPVFKSPVILKSSQPWDVVITAMKDVASAPGGTARSLAAGTPYTIAAKTGTAQVFRPKSYGDKDSDAIPKKYRSHSWLIAFAPVESPKIAVAALVENLPHAAVQVAKKVMDYYLLPDYPGSTPAPAPAGQAPVTAPGDHPNPITVPAPAPADPADQEPENDG